MQNQPQSKPDLSLEQVPPIHEAERKMHVRACAITALEELEEDVVEDCDITALEELVEDVVEDCAMTALEELEEDVVEDCAIPQYQDSPSIKLPTCPRAILHIIVGRRGFCSVKPQELPKLNRILFLPLATLFGSLKVCPPPERSGAADCSNGRTRDHTRKQ